MPNVQPQTVIFLGPQGSGKGTQVTKLEEYLTAHDARKVVRFTMGQALREFMASSTYTADIVRPSMNRGELQPLFLAGALFADHFIRSIERGDEHILIDGFPREENQIDVIDSLLTFYKREPVTILHIGISDQEALTRLLKRGRADDTEEIIKQRLAWSLQKTAPIKAWFNSNPRYRWLEINGERTVEEIHADIVAQLGIAA